MANCRGCGKGLFSQGKCDYCGRILNMDNRCGSCYSHCNGICEHLQAKTYKQKTSSDFGCGGYHYAAD